MNDKREKFLDEVHRMGILTDDMFKQLVIDYANDFTSGKTPDGSVFTFGFKKGDFHGIDIGLCIDKGLSEYNLRRLTFVKEAFDGNQIKKFLENGINIAEIIEQGKFSNSMSSIRSIEPKNTVNIGIIDSSFKVDELSEFAGRNIHRIVLTKDEGGIHIASPDEIKAVDKNKDDFHGKTTACIAAGNECGLLPNSNVYLFQLNGVSHNEARQFIIENYKENNLDVLMQPSLTTENDKKEFQGYLNNLPGNKKCEFFNVLDFWQNCAWGRRRADGKIEIDEMAEEIISKLSDPSKLSKDIRERAKIMGNIEDKVLIPCTGMTGVQEDFNNEDKYYGSVCGASFPTVILGSIFAATRQINPNITKDHFFEVMRETALTNDDGMKYLNEDGLINKVKEEYEQSKQETEQQTGDLKKAIKYASAGARADAKLGGSLMSDEGIKKLASGKDKKAIGMQKNKANAMVSDLEQSQEMKKNKSEVSLNDE